MVKCKIEKNKTIESQEKSKYPYLGIHEHGGCIVLFLDSSVGVAICVNDFCVFNEKKISVGDYFESIKEDNFKKYDGELTISNG